MQSDEDSEGSDHNPDKRCQNLYDILKFIGVLLYQVSFCMMIAYLKTSNFASQYLVDIFKGFIVLRASLVLLYSICTSLLAVHKGKYTRANIREKKQSEVELQNEERNKNHRRHARDDFNLPSQKKGLDNLDGEPDVPLDILRGRVGDDFPEEEREGEEEYK